MVAGVTGGKPRGLGTAARWHAGATQRLEILYTAKGGRGGG